jgi:hypothetical protein
MYSKSPLGCLRLFDSLQRPAIALLIIEEREEEWEE